MKLIIDIPDDDYKFIKDLQFYNSGRRNGRTIENHVINGIRTGIPYEERSQGKWIDHSGDEGYVECPICNCLTNCVDNIDELHYCWNCGAYMQKGGAV